MQSFEEQFLLKKMLYEEWEEVSQELQRIHGYAHAEETTTTKALNPEPAKKIQEW